MSSVLFRQVPPAVDELIEERRRTGVDRFDEVWDGVYVVNPPPSFRHSTIAGRIHDLLRSPAEARGLVVRREVGVGAPDDHRIPDVVVADSADLDGAQHYLLTARIAVEVLSPSDRVDKKPFYRARGVDEVVIVDPEAVEVQWTRLTPTGDAYEPITTSTVVDLGPDDITPLIES